MGTCVFVNTVNSACVARVAEFRHVEAPRAHVRTAVSDARFRRRLLNAAVNVLVLELALSLALWVVPTLNAILPGGGQSAAVPRLLPVEVGTDPARKAINHVPLADLTFGAGMDIVPWGGPPLRADIPYGFVLVFQNVTIVNVQKGSDHVWLGLAMPGETLVRYDFNKHVVNFDGTSTEEFHYRGFTAWILVDQSTYFQSGPASRLAQGLSGHEKTLRVGNTLQFTVNITQLSKAYQAMNKASFDLLEKNLGKPNTDRSDQTFRFFANFVVPAAPHLSSRQRNVNLLP